MGGLVGRCVKPEYRGLVGTGRLRALLEVALQRDDVRSARRWPSRCRTRSENGERERMGAQDRWRIGEARVAKVSERTVSRYMRRAPPSSGSTEQSWLTFLRNHREESVVGMDFFVVPTTTFRLSTCWFTIRHSRREVDPLERHGKACTVVVRGPATAGCLPFDEAGSPLEVPVVRPGRDLSAAEVVRRGHFDRALDPRERADRSPWQKRSGRALCRRERLGASCSTTPSSSATGTCGAPSRGTWPTVGGIGRISGSTKTPPLTRPVEGRPRRVVVVHHALRRVGGLHHRYCWQAAASVEAVHGANHRAVAAKDPKARWRPPDCPS